MELVTDENGEKVSEIIVTYYYEKIKETPKPEEQKPGQEPDIKQNQNNQRPQQNNPVPNQQQVLSNGQTQNSDITNENKTDKTQNEKTPGTGDILPIVAISILFGTVLVNIIQIFFIKNKKVIK